MTGMRPMTPAEVEAWLVEVIRHDRGDDDHPVETGARFILDDLDDPPSLDDLLGEIEDYVGADIHWTEEPNAADLARILDIELTDDDVETIEANRKKWTLRDLAAFLAERGRMVDLEPASCLGVDNWRVSAFRAVRDLLLDVGVDRRRIRPTARVAELAPLSTAVWNGRIHLLAPGRLPFLEPVYTRFERAMGMAFGVAFAAVVVGAVLHWVDVKPWGPLLWAGGFLVVVWGSLIDRLFVRPPRERRYTYGELETLADVCAVIETAQRARGRRS